MSEHLHVVISIPPKLAVATLIGQLKGSSSHHVNERYMNSAFAWQAEYGVLSFSERSLSRVVDYVKNQKKHHAENTLNMSMENFGVVE
jgi:putative transposase